MNVEVRVHRAGTSSVHEMRQAAIRGELPPGSVPELSSTQVECEAPNKEAAAAAGCNLARAGVLEGIPDPEDREATSVITEAISVQPLRG